MFHSPLRILCLFVLVLCAAMLLAALISPPLQWILQALLGPLDGLRLHKIFNRAVQVLVLGLLAWLLVRQGLAHLNLLGYERPLPVFLKRLGVGLLLGGLMMVLVVVPLFRLDLRAWNPGRVPYGALALAAYLLNSIRVGLVIAFVEETLFRGALQGALERAGARRVALFCVPALYAAVHFFGEAVRIPDDEVTLLSGFTVLSGYLSLFRDPPHIWDAFVSLYLVGLLLALVRRRTGGIATCIGLHAGFVAVITVLRRISLPLPSEDWGHIVGSYDGLLGLWVAMVAALACLLVWQLPRRAAT